MKRSVSDPDQTWISIGSTDPEHWQSGSRQAKIVPQKRKKMKISCEKPERTPFVKEDTPTYLTALIKKIFQCTGNFFN
jgi:hypothetical protein